MTQESPPQHIVVLITFHLKAYLIYLETENLNKYNTITGTGTSHHRFDTDVINEDTIFISKTLVLKPNTHAVDTRNIDNLCRILILVG